MVTGVLAVTLVAGVPCVGGRRRGALFMLELKCKTNSRVPDSCQQPVTTHNKSGILR